jgi:hypothetical protein
MKRSLALGFVALWLFSASRVSGQTGDLRCYKVKDPQQRAKYTADLGGLAAQPGCVIKVPAVMICSPAAKTNVDPAPPGSAVTGTPGPIGCYKMKCPKPELSPVSLDDEFGSRTVTPSRTLLLCAPARSFTCGDSVYPQCGGTCPNGQVCQNKAIRRTISLDPPECDCDARCECVDPAAACDGQPCASGFCVADGCYPLPITIERCETCGADGDPCESNADCCCDSCSDHPVGTVGFCQGSYGDPGCHAPCR